jgi:GT2 family glycosyltransferase
MADCRTAVLITSFNRRESTLKSLASLYRQTAQGIRLAVFLVDDASKDGTREAVQAQFPEVRILLGDGSLFWNGGMRKAFAAAREVGFDAYLFLNDDTVLYDDALERIASCAAAWSSTGKPAIVVGSTRSPITGEHTYGGIFRRVGGVSVRLEKVKPGHGNAIACDTMNGNCAFIPRAIADVVGNLDGRFRHQFGDLDYGFRARKAGFSVAVFPGYVGECSANSSVGTWRDPALPFAKRWRHLTSPKGVPMHEWFLFTRRHFGWRWVYYAISPYLNTIASSFLARSSAS